MRWHWLVRPNHLANGALLPLATRLCRPAKLVGALDGHGKLCQPSDGIGSKQCSYSLRLRSLCAPVLLVLLTAADVLEERVQVAVV